MATTTVQEWRQSRIVEVELPSGNRAKLKRVSLIDLIEQGRIPDTLSGMAIEAATQSKLRKISLAELLEYVQVVNLVVKACFEEPQVEDQGSETSLGVDDIDFVDRAHVFQWANGVANELRPFRPEGEKRTFHAS